MESAQSHTEVFDWSELAEVFRFRDESEYAEEQKQAILERINRLAEQHGKDFVIKRIALSV